MSCAKLFSPAEHEMKFLGVLIIGPVCHTHSENRHDTVHVKLPSAPWVNQYKTSSLWI